MKKRCAWCLSNNLLKEYHDKEWGTPVKNDKKHFEFFLLESFQAGLSWLIILKKRKDFKNAFSNFNVIKVANYSEEKIKSLMNNKSIIRNKAKIICTISNAKKFMEIQKEFESFNNYIWSFTNRKVITNKFKTEKDIPVKTELSDKISKDLYLRGFKFCGSTIIYSYMQAIGMVNDHITCCFRHKELII